MKRSALFISLIVITITANLSFAGRYELIEGKGVEVCEAYGKNLNSFGRPTPMACEREIYSTSKGFKKPEWTKLDVWENRELAKNIELFIGNYPRGTPNENTQKWEEGLKDRAESLHMGIAFARINIDNDGKLENVVKYYEGPCEDARKYATPILVVNSDMRTLDVEKTMQLMQNPTIRIKNPNPQYGDIISGPPTGGWEGIMYDVFFYKDRTYFDRWGPYRHDNANLKVYLTTGIKTAEICTYRFDKTK